MMDGITVYHYPNCGTCRKALKWFEDKDIEIEKVHIVEHPPGKQQLKKMIDMSGLDIKKFFNTSGQVYKQENVKEQLPTMTDDEKIELLASNGMLIKRPLVSDGKKVTVGFNESQYEETWG